MQILTSRESSPQLFEKHKGKGTVWVTMKRCAPDARFARFSIHECIIRVAAMPGADHRPSCAANMKPPPKKGKEPAAAQGPDGGDSAEHRCLVRATDGKKKFSTVVSSPGCPCLPLQLISPTVLAILRTLLVPPTQLAPNQIAKFHSAYTTLQKARAIFCPDKLPVRGAEVRLRSQLKRALHHVQAHMDSLKSKKKEKKKPTKGPVAKKPEGKGHSTRA